MIYDMRGSPGVALFYTRLYSDEQVYIGVGKDDGERVVRVELLELGITIIGNQYLFIICKKFLDDSDKPSFMNSVIKLVADKIASYDSLKKLTESFYNRGQGEAKFKIQQQLRQIMGIE